MGIFKDSWNNAMSNVAEEHNMSVPDVKKRVAKEARNAVLWAIALIALGVAIAALVLR